MDEFISRCVIASCDLKYFVDCDNVNYNGQLDVHVTAMWTTEPKHYPNHKVFEDVLFIVNVFESGKDAKSYLIRRAVYDIDHGHVMIGHWNDATNEKLLDI